MRHGNTTSWLETLDAFPLRCPGDFLKAVRTVAERNDAILIDAPALLSRMVPDGIVDDRLFHDAHHMNLAGYVAVAQEILVQLERRRLFGWPASVPAPRIQLADCARHFGLNGVSWSEICERSAIFYARAAYVRHDPSERLKVIDRYAAASHDLATGRPLSPDHPPSLNLEVPILDPAVAPPPKRASRSQCAEESREEDSRPARAPAVPVRGGEGPSMRRGMSKGDLLAKPSIKLKNKKQGLSPRSPPGPTSL